MTVLSRKRREYNSPAGIYLFKVNNKNTRTRCELRYHALTSTYCYCYYYHHHTHFHAASEGVLSHVYLSYK